MLSLRWKTGCLRRDCRHTVTPQRLSDKETRLPQQDVKEDASTSGVAETSGMRCSAGLCRDTKPKSPQRQGRKMRLPRQHARSDAATSLVERTEIPELKDNHHDVRDPLTSAKEDRKILLRAANRGINQTIYRAGALSNGVGRSLRVGYW